MCSSKIRRFALPYKILKGIKNPHGQSPLQWWKLRITQVRSNQATSSCAVCWELIMAGFFSTSAISPKKLPWNHSFGAWCPQIFCVLYTDVFFCFYNKSKQWVFVVKEQEGHFWNILRMAAFVAIFVGIQSSAVYLRLFAMTWNITKVNNGNQVMGRTLHRTYETHIWS